MIISQSYLLSHCFLQEFPESFGMTKAFWFTHGGLKTRCKILIVVDKDKVRGDVILFAGHSFRLARHIT